MFARNEPVIVVPSGNPAAIHDLRELPRAQRIVVGAPDVPIGAYTLRIFEAASARYGHGFRSALEARIASRELNVRQVLAKVRLGEADAAIVYRTDALAAHEAVETISIPADLNVVAEYPIAALREAAHPVLARVFIELVLSPAGRANRIEEVGIFPCIGRGSVDGRVVSEQLSQRRQRRLAAARPDVDRRVHDRKAKHFRDLHCRDGVLEQQVWIHRPDPRELARLVVDHGQRRVLRSE